MVICQTCGVEHAEALEVCAICADERQWLPATGQAWTTPAELRDAGHKIQVRELEPDLFAMTSEPGVGIGQQSHLVRTNGGNLLWDPVAHIDDDGIRQVQELGEVTAIVASHPHMFGVQVEWSHALGNAPVLVAEADMDWVARPNPVISPWSGTVDVLPGLRLIQLGGHFPGSAVAYWQAGAGGRGVLLSGDTIKANPDRRTASFMRSFPNRIPLSAQVVARLTGMTDELSFDRLYDNLGNTIGAGAREQVRASGDRHIGWVRGDFDHLT